MQKLLLFLLIFLSAQLNAAQVEKKYDGVVLTFTSHEKLIEIKNRILNAELNVLYIEDDENDLFIEFGEPQKEKFIEKFKIAVERIANDKITIDPYEYIKDKENNTTKKQCIIM